MEKNPSRPQRRPQEHNRKATVVQSGSQAGKARKGSVVNKGVHYDDVKKGRRPVSDVAELAADDHASSRGEDERILGFLPERLRWLPEEPLGVFGDLEVKVECGEETHTVHWDENGNVDVVDHDYVAESVVAALGGDSSQCMLTKDALRHDHGMSILSPSWSLFNTPTRFKGELLKDASVDGLEREAALWEMLGRSGRAGAVAYVARKVTEAWIQSMGGAPVTGSRGQVFINRKEGAPVEKAELYSWIPQDAGDGRRAVAAYGTWGDDENTRFILNVNEDWYEDVRSQGFLVQGRLNLGRNEEGQVIADIDPRTCALYARVLKEGEVLRPIDEVVAEAREKYEEFIGPIRERDDNGGGVFVGELTAWDYNDEYYYPQEGTSPVATFKNAAEAVSWMRFINIRDTYFNPVNNPSEYYEDESYLPDSCPTDPSRYDLMDACANEGTPLIDFAVPFAEYTHISDDNRN